MEGLGMYRVQALAEPDSILKATSLCRNEMNSVERVVKEHVD